MAHIPLMPDADAALYWLTRIGTSTLNRDTKVRTKTFQWLDEVSLAHEEILLGAMLQRGFTLDVKSRSLSSGNR